MSTATNGARDAHSPLAVWRHPAFRLGAREMVAVSLGVSAWGLVTGMAMVNSGLGVPLSVFMSLAVYAGSAQLASLPLLAAGAPLWLIWATAFCVNLRFVIFSAQWRPFLIHLSLPRRLWHAYLTTDMGYVLFTKRYPQMPQEPDTQEQMAYFWGGAVTNWLAWQVASMAGIALAETIPSHWGIGFAGTIALLALTCSLINDRITVAAACVAASAAVVAYALPLRLNIVVAIASAVVVGVVLDKFQQAAAATPAEGGSGSTR